MRTIRIFVQFSLFLSSIYLSRCEDVIEETNSLKAGEVSMLPTHIISDTDVGKTSTVVSVSSTSLESYASKIFEVRSASKTEKSKTRKKPKAKQAEMKDDSYLYTIRVNQGRKSGKEYKGLLVNKNIVASVKVPDTTSAELCQKNKCQNTRKRKDSKHFSYWLVDSRRRSPVVFPGYRFVHKKCASNNDNHSVVLDGTDKMIDCRPNCKNGDVVVCNNFATGIILGKDKKTLATVRTIMGEGNFYRRRVEKRRKQGSKTKRSAPKTDENEEK